jgi:hypothetical protein
MVGLLARRVRLVVARRRAARSKTSSLMAAWISALAEPTIQVDMYIHVPKLGHYAAIRSSRVLTEAPTAATPMTPKLAAGRRWPCLSAATCGGVLGGHRCHANPSSPAKTPAPQPTRRLPHGPD